jgi:hypothetical protein
MAGTLTISTLSDGTNSTSATNPIRGSARAWVNFVSSSGSINGAFNVSSITRHSTGIYTVNMTTAMPNANYVMNTTGECQNAVTSLVVVNPNIGGTNGSKTTTQFGLIAVNSGFATIDANNINVSVFSS